KELPDAFLRRCFFHYIRFPDRDTMAAIVDVHFPGLQKALLREALTAFYEIRDVPGLKKKPSTSELLDWIKTLPVEDCSPYGRRQVRRSSARSSRSSRAGSSSTASPSCIAASAAGRRRDDVVAHPLTLSLSPLGRGDAVA